jgi:hypothetical protein
MMNAEIVVTPNALNAVLALAGAMLGLVISAIGARQILISDRAARLQVEVEDTLEEFRVHKNEPAALREAISQQREAVERTRSAVQRRQVFYRLVTGYLTLMTLGLTAVAILLETQNFSSREIPYGWFIFGVLAAFALAGTLYLLAAVNRIRLNKRKTLSLGPIAITPSIDPDFPDQVPLAEPLQNVCTEWLLAQGFGVFPAPPSSGFDLFARQDSELVAIEIKSGEKLTLWMVDTLVGALMRARTQSPAPDRILLFAPQQTISRTSDSVLHAAANQSVGIVSVGADGTITPMEQRKVP